MTLDEAIENLEQDVEIDMYINDIAPQLAEWLEELKKRRSEDYGYMADIHQSIGYRKAIDDFVKALRIEYSPVSDEMQNEYDNVCLRFEKIAEQLKEGDDNA